MYGLLAHLRRVAAILLLAIVVVAPDRAFAAAAAAPAASTAAELETLLKTIEDPVARERLAGQLRALIAAQQKTDHDATTEPPTLGTRLLSTLADQVQEINRAIFGAFELLSDVPGLANWLTAQIQDPDRRAAWIRLLTKLAATLAAGAIAFWLAGRLLTAPRKAIEVRMPRRLFSRVILAAGYMLLDLVPIAAFTIGAYVIMPLLDARPNTRLVAVTLVNAIIVSGACLVLARAALAPRAAALRLLPISDETAHYGYIWARRLTYLIVFGYFGSQAAGLIGMPRAGASFLLKVVGLTVATLFVILVAQNRTVVANWLRGKDSATVLGIARARLAETWHLLAIFYIAAIFVVWAVDIPGGFEFIVRSTAATIVILLAGRIILIAIQRLLQRGFAVGDDAKQRFPGLEERVNRYVPVLQLVLQGVVAVVAALALLEVWGVNAVGWLGSPIGRRVSSAGLSIAVIVVLALAVWEAVNAMIARYFARTDKDGRVIERSQRARTLLPLVRAVLSIVLTVIVVLIVLSELGVNIGPLLAGAGVVGLAIGFGSQKLVQDVITGAFILIEDAISVGDVVQVGAHSGLVEAISIRSVRLRDANGSVHTVPFSSVSTVINMTKNFSYYVLDVGVAYREDTDAVTAALRSIDEELRKDPDFGWMILEPLEVLGVERFDASAVIIRARIKTQPIKQWTVGREFNRRMKKRFDELGIEMPFPHTTLYFGADKVGRAPPMRVKVDPTRESDDRPSAHDASHVAHDSADGGPKI